MWEQIRANRRRSLILMSAMVFVLCLMGGAVGVILGGARAAPIGVIGGLVVAFIQMLVYMAASETIVLSGTGAREISKEDCPRLFNIVEEMKLASGLEHMPRIFMIDDSSPNAFAFGRRPQDAAVAVTTGLLQRLNRDELQGVIAHELGHIRNQDVQFMMKAAVILASIAVMSDILWMSRFSARGRSRSSSRGESSGQLEIILLILAIVIVIVGPILAQVFYFACSRKREYLADACSAQYTRYPEGLASALEKIQRAAISMSSVTKATAPMYIINPMYAAEAEPRGLFSTHPPTSERVGILRAMSGASVADYEKAFEAQKGSSVIGGATLQQASSLAKRQGSSEGPIEERSTLSSTVHRMYGYIEVPCSCGMTMRVPTTFENEEVVCVRCGSRIPLPSAEERYAQASPADSQQSGAAQPPMQYTRKSKGWEAFRCSCGSSVQLSPSFNAPHTTCPKCGRQIDVMEPSTV